MKVKLNSNNFYLIRWVSKEQILIYGNGLAQSPAKSTEML